MATLEQSLQLNDQFSEKLQNINEVAQKTLQTFEGLQKVLQNDYNLQMSADTSEIENAVQVSNRLAEVAQDDHTIILTANDAEIQEAVASASNLQQFMLDDFSAVLAVDSSEMDKAVNQSQDLEKALLDDFSANIVTNSESLEQSLQRLDELERVLQKGLDGEVSVDQEDINQALMEMERLQQTLQNDFSTVVSVENNEIQQTLQDVYQLDQTLKNDLIMDIEVDYGAFEIASQRINEVEAELTNANRIMDRMAMTDPLQSLTYSAGKVQQLNSELTQSSAAFTRIASGTDRVLGKMMRLPLLSDKWKASLSAGVILWQEMHTKQSRVVQGLDRMRGAVTKVTSSQNKLVQGVVKMAGAVVKAHRPMTRFGSLVVQAGGHILRNIRNQQRMNKELSRQEQAQARFNQLTRLMQFGVALAALSRLNQYMSSLIEKADKFVSTMARLNIANDGSQTLKEFSDSILAAAIRSRSAYQDTADFISKLAINAGDAFTSNDEVIAFAETLNKAYKISGASAEEQASSMLQLTQALSAGALRGEELNSVMEGAPLIIQAIADELNVTKGELKELASEGVISADIIKAAMFNAADDINAKFATIPLTWADMMTYLANVTVYAFQPVIQAFNDFVNSTMGQQMFEGIAIGIFALAQIATWAFSAITAGIQWVMDNINVLAMGFVIMGGIIAAVAFGAAVAWMVANWPLVLMIAIIVAIINIMNSMGISALQVAAVIAGGIAWLGTVFYDVIVFVVGIFIMLGQTIYNIFAYAWNVVASFVEFFANVWRNPVYSTQMLFYNLVKNVLNFLGSIADGAGSAATALGNAFVGGVNIAIKALNGLIGLMNKIPGINIGTVGELASFGEGNTLGDNIRGMAEVFNPGDAPDNYWTAPKMAMAEMSGYDFIANNMKNPNQAYTNTYNAVNSLGDISFDGFGDFTGMLDKNNGLMAGVMDGLAGTPGDYSDLLGGGDDDGKGAGDKLGKGKEIGDIGKIKSEVSITEEDIKLMRDIAERNFIIKYQQVTPQATVNLNGSGSSETDAKKLLHLMEKMIVEQSSNDLVPEG